jgi:hypothetical protein
MLEALVVDNRIFVSKSNACLVEEIFAHFSNSGPISNMDNIYWTFAHTRLNVMKSYLYTRGFEII